MFRLLLLGFCLIGVAPVQAQLAAPNDTGVAMGHLHFFVDDVASNRDFWVRLGGTAVPFPAGEIVKLPGLLVLISERGSMSSSSVIDHVAFRVDSLAEIAARGFEIEMVQGFPGIASIYTPSGDRVELFEEGTATNIGFDPAPDSATAVSLRHNRPLRGQLDSHHLHFYIPEAEIVAARDWYVRQFGAIPGLRWRYDAADLPGMNLNFSAANNSRAGTQGQSLDHIGFEVVDLEAFCADLIDAGIDFDQPYQRVGPDFAFAILTDPWGTTIELTEGLTEY